MSKLEDSKTKLSQLERVREIHRFIKRYTEHPTNKSFRVTEPILMEKLDVCDRTIRRDLDLLRERIDERDIPAQLRGEGHPLYFDKKHLSFRYTRPVDLSVWLGRLDEEELGSLLVAQQALAVFSGMPLAKHVSDIFENDAGGWVGNARSVLRDEITSLISFYPDGAGKIDQDQFTTIFRGLLMGRQLAVSYQSKASSSAIARTLHPYHLCCFHHQWRLIAYDSKSEEIRDFVVTPRRLKSVRLLTRTFKRPADFDAHRHLSRHKDQEIRLITIRVTRAGAHHVLERNWSGLRSTTDLGGGAIEAVFEVGDIGEFERFVLAFGGDCTVVAPADFREDIQREARLMLEQKWSD